MKSHLFILIILMSALNALSQQVKFNPKGKIKSVNFNLVQDKSKIPESSQDFFKSYLHVGKYFEFKENPGSYNHSKFKNETHQQYYKGVEVENASYSFHFKEDTLKYAHGNFVDIEDMDVTPAILPVEARNTFAKYKNIPLDSIRDYQCELLIKEFPLADKDSVTTIKLVYRVSLDANLNTNDEIGYIDAQTGNMLNTSSRFSDYSNTGKFYTRYSDIQYAKTMIGGDFFEYILKDDSRGTTIHTKNLNNSYSITDASEIGDEDNTWTAAEHSPNNVNMGLDVHWALQEIYDYFYENYEGIESFDNAKFPINAYIRYGGAGDKDRSRWDNISHHLLFGEGYTTFNPMASLDVVAHEYGHGISDLKAGMPYSENHITAILQEGLSDIWAVILENAIHPNDIWKIGEQVVQTGSCARNIANPTDPNALTQLITTYGSPLYNSSEAGVYAKSGVMSYWFYLLVNGGAGTNGLGNSYYLGGVGMDEAQRFFTETVYGNFFTGDWTYQGMREAFVQSSILNGYGSYFTTQVELAWYAVGVGTKPAQQSIVGSYSVCNNGGTDFFITNLLPGSTVVWTYSQNLYSCGGGADYIKLCPQGTGSGTISAIIHNGNIQVELPVKQVKVGVNGTLSAKSW